VQAWCQRHAIFYTTDTSDGVVYYRLDRCFFLEASPEGHAHGVTAHHDRVSFLCVWERDTATGTPGKIGAGCHTPWCQKEIARSGLPGWEHVQRLADPDYAERARAWDTMRAQRQHDQALQAKFASLGADAMQHAQEGGVQGAAVMEMAEDTLLPEVRAAAMRRDARTARHEPTPILDALYPDALAYHGHFPLNDTGNAERLLARYGTRLLHVSPGWGWYHWEGQRWCKDDDDKRV